MKINFTKKEYATLIEMIDIANWVISSHKIEKGSLEKPYEDLEVKIYSLAPEFDCGDKLEFSKELKGYYATHYFEMESPHRKFIDDYDNETFWTEVIDRLALRDSIRKVGEAEYRKLEGIDRLTLLHKYEEYWATEFEKNGLENVCVKT